MSKKPQTRKPHPREMEGKKYKGSCGNGSAPRGWESRLRGPDLLGLPCPRRCHCPHVTDCRTRTLQRTEVIDSEGHWGLSSHQGPRGSFHRTSLLRSGSQEWGGGGAGKRRFLVLRT